MSRIAVKSQQKKKQPAKAALTQKSGQDRQPAGANLTQQNLAPQNILRLQQLMGNAAVQRLMPGHIGVQRCHGNQHCTCPKCKAERQAKQNDSLSAAPIQRKLGDGHDLSAAPIAGDARLEEAYDGVQSKYVGSGAQGEPVRKIQSALLKLGHKLPVFGPDGDYGGETKAAVIEFQTSKSIGHDGTVGPETLTALDAALAVGPSPTPLPGTMPTAGPDDFKIDHVGTSDQGKLFFGRDSSTPSGDALTAITDIKAAAPASVRLIGYASADEDPALATARAQEIESRLAAGPDPVTVVSATGNPGATETSSNFSGARNVEVLTGLATPKTTDCEAVHDSGPDKGKPINPPTQPCPAMDPDTWSAFNTVQPIALEAMNRAVPAANAADSSFNPALVDKFFGNHDAATLGTLATNLGNLRDHVRDLASSTQCGGECDRGGCENGAIAYMNGVDSASTMTLCVPTFKSLNENDAARNLIHESAHGTSPLGGGPDKGTRDVAYRHERIIDHLSPEERLRNSDSYALFALYVRETQDKKDPDAVPEGISTPSEDNLVNFKDDAEKNAINLAVAHLEKRLSWSRSHIGQLYGQILKVKDREISWRESWAENLMRQTAARFPVTSPPTRPTLDDQTLVAALNDRYFHMYKTVKRDLTITRLDAGIVNWAADGDLGADNFGVGPDFFTASLEYQISLLLQALANAVPDVEDAFIPAYVTLAEWMHNNANE